MNKNYIIFQVLITIIFYSIQIFASDDVDEQLLFMLPDNWNESYTDRTENLSTSEYVPTGQSMDDWQEMISVQVLLESPDTDPDKMLSRVATHLKNECVDFIIKPITLTGLNDKYPTLAMMTICGKKTEKDFGEIGLVRGISGKTNFYLLQKIWKTKLFKSSGELPINLEQRKFWLGYIAYLGVCSPQRNNCPENAGR